MIDIFGSSNPDSMQSNSLSAIGKSDPAAFISNENFALDRPNASRSLGYTPRLASGTLSVDSLYQTFSFNVVSDGFYADPNKGNINLSLHDIISANREGGADLYLFRDTNNNGMFDSADTLVGDSTYSRNTDEYINYRVDPGTYFAQVRRSPASSGDVRYQLEMSSAKPNNLLTGGADLTPYLIDGIEVINYSINSQHTSSIYSFDAGNRDGVNIRLFGLTSDADIRIIQDANNNRIIDSGEVLASSIVSGNEVESISYQDARIMNSKIWVQVYQYAGDTNYSLVVGSYSSVD